MGAAWKAALLRIRLTKKGAEASRQRLFLQSRHSKRMSERFEMLSGNVPERIQFDSSTSLSSSAMVAKGISEGHAMSSSSVSTLRASGPRCAELTA